MRNGGIGDSLFLVGAHGISAREDDPATRGVLCPGPHPPREGSGEPRE